MNGFIYRFNTCVVMISYLPAWFSHCSGVAYTWVQPVKCCDGIIAAVCSTHAVSLDVAGIELKCLHVGLHNAAA